MVIDSRPSGHSHIFGINAEGGHPGQVAGGDAENGVADWSVDDKSIYFGSSRGGSWEIWKVAVEGGTPTQVTSHGGVVPAPRRDGQIFFFSNGAELPAHLPGSPRGGKKTANLEPPP